MMPLGMMNFDMEDEYGMGMDGPRFRQADIQLPVFKSPYMGSPNMFHPMDGGRGLQGLPGDFGSMPKPGMGFGGYGDVAHGNGGLRYAPEMSLDQLSGNRNAPNRGGGKGKGKGRGKQGKEPMHPMAGFGHEGANMKGLGPLASGGIPNLMSLLPAGMSERQAVPPPTWGDTTTIMMRNLPNKYTQRMLLTEINEAGFLGSFDFLYLPIDPETSANRGYAFLNFIDASFAWLFKMANEGNKMKRFNSSKVVSVMPATLQGFDANYAHYSTARVNRGDPAARPLFLREPTQPALKAASANKQGNQRRKGNAPPSEPAVSGMAPVTAGADEVGGGSQLDGSNAADRPTVPRFCPHCGGAVQGHFQFCPHCGGNIDPSSLRGI